MKAGPVALPSANAVPMPVVTTATSRVAFCHGVSAFVSSFAASFDGVAGATGGGAGRGAGGRICPLSVTIAPRTTSSERSTLKCFSWVLNERMNFVMLLEYSVDDCVGNRDGKSV